MFQTALAAINITIDGTCENYSTKENIDRLTE
jgi:hypothetical protein